MIWKTPAIWGEKTDLIMKCVYYYSFIQIYIDFFET